ncbi:MAG: serine/threonine-protein kinase [Planctomycetota bacterium]
MNRSAASPGVWAEAKALFGELTELPRDERESALRERSVAEEVRVAVWKLLDSHDSLDGFLDDSGPKPMTPARQQDPGLPERIGPYEPIERLGEGGFGVVYRARQRDPVDREVAVKLLKPGYDSPQLLARFTDERHLLVRVDHPDVVKVLDAGATSDGRSYVVMELARGEPITDFVRLSNLSLTARIRLMVRVIRAVHAVHQRAVIHRDLKPTNIMVGDDTDGPRPRIIDFGIATVVDEADRAGWTQAGTPIGTPKYASPEQFRGDSGVDIRTDVYSLGMVLCEVLTGRLPREPSADGEKPATPPSRLAEQACEPDIGRLARGDIDRIVLKAIAWEPDLRYGSAAALADDLERCLAGEPVLAAPPSRSYVLRKFVSRHRIASAAVAVALASLFIGFGSAVVGQWRAVRGQRAAEANAERAHFIGGFLLETLIENADPDVRNAPSVLSPEDLDVLAERAAAGADEDPETMVNMLQQIARLQNNYGGARKAKDTYATALRVAINHYGTPHPEVVEARVFLADTIAGAALGKYLDLLEKAEQEALALYGDDHPKYLRVWQRQDRSVEELEALRRRYEGDSSVEPADVLALYGDLGFRYMFARRTDDLLDITGRHLEIAEEHFGPDHTLTRSSRSFRATTLHSSGRFDEAAVLFREVQADSETRYGRDSQQFGVSSRGLAMSLRGMGRPAEALMHARAALEWTSAEPLAIAVSQLTLGSVLIDLGRYEEAVEVLRPSADEHRRRWPEGHRQIWRVEMILAEALVGAESYDEVAWLLEDLRSRIDPVSDGEAHARVLAMLAETLRGLGCAAEADEILRRIPVADEAGRG